MEMFRKKRKEISYQIQKRCIALALPGFHHESRAAILSWFHNFEVELGYVRYGKDGQVGMVR